MEENKTAKQISDYLTLQLALCRSHSQENGVKSGNQTDRMFWAGAVGTCDALKSVVEGPNLQEVAEKNTGKNVATEIFKLTETDGKGKKVLLKPHCPKCLSSELDEMGTSADGVKSYVCRPCMILFHILSIQDF
ncbi:MAG: hypothetical protein WC554_06145 [Clostridia bacterium]|jgi:cytochrome c551/c552